MIKINTLVLDLSEIYTLKVLIENEGTCLLEVEAENSTDTFLVGRGKFTQKGFLELDFDGTLKQEKNFARFIYPVRKASTSISFRVDGEYIQYLKTPLGFYSVRYENGNYIIKKEPKSPVFEWVKNEILNKEQGILTTRDRNNAKITDMAEFVDKKDKKREDLAEHIIKFFGMEKAND